MSFVHACYPGSFDPVTRGHLDVVRRAAAIFGRLTVGVGLNAGKSPLFTPEERAEMIRAEIGDLAGVDVEVFEGLVVEWCRRKGMEVMVRGLRGVSDFEAEYQMVMTNRSFDPEIETLFIMPEARFAHISSRLIREVVMVGGSVEAFVPEAVAAALARRLRDEGSKGA
jgi:pantetheine-phosphate adenylyltransferase